MSKIRGIDTYTLKDNVSGLPQNDRPMRGPSNGNDISGTVRGLFGSGLQVTQTGINLDLRRGLDHASTGIPYAINGTATIVNQRVAYALATYQDPIKAVLGMAMHKEQKIVIRRKFVVGGHAMITPEHAQARTVAVREEEIEYVMARYGSDVFMNLNLFLKPELAEEELNMKLDAQIAALNQTQCRLAYDMIMKQGTRLTSQLASQRVANSDLTKTQREAAAIDTYVHTIFGAMSRFEHPLSNLLAAAQQANAFGNINYDVLLAPCGMLPLEMYTPEHSVKFAVTGVSASSKAPIEVGLENIRRDPRTNLKIGIVQPFPDSATAQSPYATSSQGGLTNTVEVGAYYIIPIGDTRKFRIPDMGTRGWDIVPGQNYPQVLMRVHKCVMSSAILAKSGSDTGEMLFAWPHTGISTSQTTETMKMQLRAYFGAVLYKRENIMILEDIHCETIKSSRRSEDRENNAVRIVGNGTVTADNMADITGPVQFENNKGASGAAKDALAAGLKGDLVKWSDQEPSTLYPGRIEEHTLTGWSVYQDNQGHLGSLENPANPAAYGQFVYNNKRAT